MDNALVNASLASKLPRGQDRKALIIGIAAGAIMRLIALFLAAVIMKYAAVKLIGAGYLVAIAVQHLCFRRQDGNGNGKSNGTGATFSGVVTNIMLADIAFSLDNVVAAVGMSPKFPVVVVGVVAGIVVMLFATQLVAILMRRYPSLEKTAYGIVGFVGATIITGYFYEEVPEMIRFSIIIGAVICTVIIEELHRFRRNHQG